MYTDTPFVAVIGLHSSGSSCLAGVIYHLGVYFGENLGGYYGTDPNTSCGFEEYGLVEVCVRSVPFESPTMLVSPDEAEDDLRRWIRKQQQKAFQLGTIAGGKYPELILLREQCKAICGDSLLLVVSERPLDESVRSLIRRDPKRPLDRIIEQQQRLWEGKEHFKTMVNNHLEVHYEDLLNDPQTQVERIIGYLGIEPTKEQIEKAIAWPRPEKRHVF